jgi:hypothetical protein
MKYTVQLPGFEGQTVEVQSGGLFSGAKLFVNGKQVGKGPKRGELLLTDSYGSKVIATWRNNFLDVPNLFMEGKIIRVVEPLKWYEWLWNGLPVALIFIGGALGGALGFLAVSINMSIFRSQHDPILKYSITGVVSFITVVVYLILGITIRSMLK